jgi:hypothetical protein
MRCNKLLEDNEPILFGDFIVINLCQQHAVEKAEREIDRAIELGADEGMKYLFGFPSEKTSTDVDK